MKMMGLSGALHWTAWFIKYFTILIVTSILLTAILKLSLGGDVAICPRTSTLILFLFFLFYSAATITFTFAVASPWAKCESNVL